MKHPDIKFKTWSANMTSAYPIILIFLTVIFTSFNTSAGLLDTQSTKTDLVAAKTALNENQTKWATSAIHDYEYVVRTICFCTIESTTPIRQRIENDLVVDSRYDCDNKSNALLTAICGQQPSQAFEQSVTDLFQKIDNAIKQNVALLDVQYDPQYGYPLSISIDPILNLSDDETVFTISDFSQPVSQAAAITSKTLLINHQWRSTTDNNIVSSANSVVFCSAPSSIGAQRGTARMRLNNSSAEFKFQEWSNLDGAHVDENMQLVRIDQGRWSSGDNQLEVGTTEISGTRQWKTIQFSTSFSTPPAVILSIQTANGADAVDAHVRNITTDSMQVALLEEEEKATSGHTVETLGYLLVSSPSGDFELGDSETTRIELPFQSRGILINHLWKTIGNGYQVRLEEDQTRDQETQHMNETVHVVKIDGIYLTQIASAIGGDTSVLRSR